MPQVFTNITVVKFPNGNLRRYQLSVDFAIRSSGGKNNVISEKKGVTIEKEENETWEQHEQDIAEILQDLFLSSLDVVKITN